MPDSLRIAICEDITEDAADLMSHIARSTIPAEYELFESGEALMRAHEKGKWHLVFLDIYMKGMSGVETAKALRALDQQVVIAFTTSSEDYALEGYRVNALKYILKPVSQRDTQDAMELALMKANISQRHITILSDGQRVDLQHDEIYYIESNDRATLFHARDKIYPTEIKMDQIELLLQSSLFLRCHRSYIVNLNRVKEVDRDFLMENGDTVYIRGKDLKQMKDAWADYLYNIARDDDD